MKTGRSRIMRILSISLMLLLALLLLACGGGGGDDPPTTFSVSGRVTLSNGTGISGVTMTFTRVSGSGSIPASVSTDASGNWSQSGFEDGTTYSVTPSRSNYTFSPSSSSFSSASSSFVFIGLASGSLTFTDTNTGLIWQDNNYETTHNLQSAVDYCSNLNLAGYSDWRLPTTFYELWDLYSSRTSLNSYVSSYYWSSTPGGSGGNIAVHFGSLHGAERPVTENNCVRCVHPFTPNLIGSYITPEMAQSVFVSGNYAYVAGRDFGLQIINISSPSSPGLVSSYNTSGGDQNVFVSGDYAYVAHRGIIDIINISNPTNPSLASSYNTPGGPNGADWVFVSGNYAYIADGNAGLHIVNVSNPYNPISVSSYPISGTSFGVFVSYNNAYIAATSGLHIVNVSNPTSPTLRGSYPTSGSWDWYNDVYISDSYAYVANGDNGVKIFDISSSSNPTLVGSYDTSPGYARRIYISGDYAYVANSDNGLLILNIVYPTNPTIVGHSDTENSAWDIFVSGGYAYVAIGSSFNNLQDGLQIFDRQGP